MSDIDTTTGASRKEQAKELIGQAGEKVKAEAQSFAHAAQERATAEARKGVDAAGKTLDAFANAVRRAGDELAGADQSPASRLVGQAAEGLENLSRGLAGKEPGELLDSVRSFGRKNPVAFIGGAVLIGLALGRFVRASESGRSLPGLSDQTLTFAEEDSYDGPAEVMAAVGIDRPIGDNLGDLSSAAPLTSVGIGDGTSGIGESDASGTSDPGASSTGR